MVLTTAPLATLRLCRSFVFVGWLVGLVVVKYTSKSNAILTQFKVPESCLPEEQSQREDPQ